MPNLIDLFVFGFLQPLLFIFIIIIFIKNKIKLLGIIIFIIISISIAYGSSFVVKGPYLSYVGGPSGIGYGYPYYFRFSDMKPFKWNWGNESNQNNAKLVIEKEYSDTLIKQTKTLTVGDVEHLITYFYNVIFWLFIIPLFYTFFIKIRTFFYKKNKK
jgi:hypothetical protein